MLVENKKHYKNINFAMGIAHKRCTIRNFETVVILADDRKLTDNIHADIKMHTKRFTIKNIWIVRALAEYKTNY